MESALRLSLYLLIPFLIYLSEANIAAWMTGRMEQVYNLSFGVLALFIIFTLKFTRRKKGFKSTPTDFLILFIALVVPNLPDDYIKSYHMGLMTAKIIVLLFSYEVLFGEFRKELRGLGLITITSLLVISFRGIL
jgi:UDP-GlcNAc:undecaprenyl-phosphate GlcNAc-1-phosphate transferase